MPAHWIPGPRQDTDLMIAQTEQIEKQLRRYYGNPALGLVKRLFAKMDDKSDNHPLPEDQGKMEVKLSPEPLTVETLREFQDRHPTIDYRKEHETRLNTSASKSRPFPAVKSIEESKEDPTISDMTQDNNESLTVTE